jgi:hypothetical protein
MSAEQLVQGVAAAINRRRFLVKIAGASAGLVGGLVGAPLTASASGTGVSPSLVQTDCCWTCLSPTLCTNCVCTWGWVCTTSSGCRFSCIECYGNGGSCVGDCNGVICSEVDRHCH